MATISSTIELVDKMSSKLKTIEDNIASMKKTLKGVSDEQSSIDSFSWSTFLANAEHAGEEMVKIGKKMSIAMTTPLVLLGKRMYGNATDYESAFAGVKKTTEATEAEYEALYEGLLQISETNPTGFVDAAGIMEMAGQLGVAKEELLGFTQAYIGLQEATNINGENGAADIARFLNVTEKSTANIDRVGGVIVGLGNNFATTEQEILNMATRMGATADLAGFSSAEILAFSAALSSVGINAEAGGSAAGKLMKKMQLAAEVGGQAQEKIAGIHWMETDKETGKTTEVWLKDFAHNGLELVNYLDTLKSADKVDIASQLGMTADSLQNMADSWLLFDQFSEVMGISGADFLKGWDASPAESMLAFFQGLGNLDPEKGNSVLAQLAEMDITEIRLSNLVAAMSGNADLFRDALALAYGQYAVDPNTNAMAEEVAKRYETQESQNKMLGNKMENTMADFGQNIVNAVQPGLDKMNELLTAFNNLSEADQDKVLATFAVFAAGGPIVSAIGGTVEAVGKIGTGFMKAKTAISGWVGKGGLSALLQNPVTWGIAAGGALLLFIDYLDSIPSKFETLAKGVKDIPITVDDTSYNDTLTKIQEVQEALDGLKPGEVRTEYENASLAVAMGFGTNDMFASSLTYEAAKSSALIGQTAADYAIQMQEAEKQIAKALGKGDTATAEAAKIRYEGLRSALDAELITLRDTYSAKISELFNGMASQYPDAAAQLEQAASDYDLMSTIFQASEFDWSAYADQAIAQAKYTDLMNQMYTQAWNAGYLKNSGYDTLDQFLQQPDLNNALWVETLQNDVMESLNNGVQTISDNPILSGWLKAILESPALTENLDVTNLSGALEGMMKMLDFKNAVDTSGKPEEFGAYLSLGMANGITNNQSSAVNAAVSMATKALNAAKNALGISSPSKETYWQGEMIVAGYVNALDDGGSDLAYAASKMVEDAWDTISMYSGLEAQALTDEFNHVKDGIKVNDADIKKIRDLAEREVINRFTTAEIRVEMNNTNNINSDMDLDGIISKLEDTVAERLEAVAEGVYN